MRDDLARAHEAARRHVVSPGSWWTGAERRAFATAVLDAWDVPSTPPPWECPPIVRMTRHAATLTEAWYGTTLEVTGWSELAFVEVCGIVSTVAALAAYAEAMGDAPADTDDATGSARPPLPPAVDGEATGEVPDVQHGQLNWVPVAAPADRIAAVVQAYSGVPGEQRNLFRMSAAQYVPMEMVPTMRAPEGRALSRPQIEVVAARLSALRECFY